MNAVEANLHYFKPNGHKPYRYNYDPPEDVATSNAEHEAHRFSIRDVRPVVGEFSLDVQGAVLAPHRTAVQNFYDDEEVKRVYYPEAELLIAETTGAKRIFVFDHTVRRREHDAHSAAQRPRREPVTRVHNDYTVRSGPQRVRTLLPDDADKLLKGRFAVINVWRPIRGPLEDAPLAFCDARSVALDDLAPMDLIYPDRVGETYLVKYNPAHRWFYAPRMRADEALLIKSYDSAEDGKARFTPHTAFEDPTTPANRLPRESIELRALVFY